MPKNESLDNLRLFKKLYNQNRDSIIFSSLAEEYRERGMITDAIQTSLEGLSNFPDCISARTTLALCYMDRGDVNGARRELEIIISKDNNLLLPLKLLLKCYERDGETGKCLQIARHILKLYPFDYETEAKIKEWDNEDNKIYHSQPLEELHEAAENFEIRKVNSLFESFEKNPKQETIKIPYKNINKNKKKLNILSNMLTMIRGLTHGA